MRRAWSRGPAIAVDASNAVHMSPVSIRLFIIDVPLLTDDKVPYLREVWLSNFHVSPVQKRFCDRIHKNNFALKNLVETSLKAAIDCFSPYEPAAEN